MKPHVTIVGAGAVGATLAKLWGPCAQSITFWIQPRHEAQLKAGFDFLKSPQLSFELPPSTDLLVIAVPSPALDDLSWLDLSKAPPQMTILLLAPGFRDRERVVSVAPEREPTLVHGTIPFLAYLEGSPQTLKHWTPPFARMLLSEGAAHHQTRIQHWFKASRLAPRVDPQAAMKMLVPDLFLRVAVDFLMSCQWDYATFLTSSSITTLRNRTLALWPAAAQLKGLPPPSRFRVTIFKSLIRPLSVRGLWWGLEKLAPFNLRDFMRTHFTKVELQMKTGMRELTQAQIALSSQ